MVVLADNDTGGKDHAEKKATTIHGIAASVRVAHFPDTPNKGDASDWLEAGHSIEDMKSHMDTTGFWQPAFAEEATEVTDNAEGHLLNRAWSESVADDTERLMRQFGGSLSAVGR